MPNRILLIFITLLLGIGSASAQKYPERSLVRKGNRDYMHGYEKQRIT